MAASCAGVAMFGSDRASLNWPSSISCIDLFGVDAKLNVPGVVGLGDLDLMRSARPKPAFGI